jgi:hypothetical protein
LFPPSTPVRRTKTFVGWQAFIAAWYERGGTKALWVGTWAAT